jgi:hypothetical protein
VQTFAQKLLAGENTELSGLISPKAKGWLKKLHDGEASDAAVAKELDKLKTALTDTQIASDKSAKGQHIVVMTEGGQMAAPGGGSYGAGGYGDGGGKKQKHKSGKTVQFTVSADYLIVDIKVH